MLHNYTSRIRYLIGDRERTEWTVSSSKRSLIYRKNTVLLLLHFVADSILFQLASLKEEETAFFSHTDHFKEDSDRDV